MHFAIQKEVLVKALRDVSNAIATRVVQPILSNVLIESIDGTSLRFTGTDLDLTIRTSAPAVVYTEGQITLPAKKLLEVVSKLPNELVSFQIKPDTFETTITCLRSRFTLSALPADDYPKLPAPQDQGGFWLPWDILKRSILQTSFAAASYDVSTMLGGVYLVVKDGAFEAVSTDGSRLAHRREELTVTVPTAKKVEVEGERETEGQAATATLDRVPELKAIVPAKSCAEVLKIFDSKDAGQRIRISVAEGQMTFETEQHFVCTRLIAGEYPRYHELFPTNHTFLAVFSREEMLGAVERSAVMSDDRTHLVKLNFDGEQLQVSSNTPDVGKAQEEIAVTFEGQTSLEVAVNFRYVVDVLQKLNSDNVRLEMTGPLKPLVFKADADESYKYLLMPVQAR